MRSNDIDFDAIDDNVDPFENETTEELCTRLGFPSAPPEEEQASSKTPVPISDPWVPPPPDINYACYPFLNHSVEAVHSKTADVRAPAELFGTLWNEGELAILFGDTGKGKSILAVQIGISIAAGLPVAPFAPAGEPQPVLYFDLELTDFQFASRYSRRSADGRMIDRYTAHPNFRRIRLETDDSGAHDPKQFRQELAEGFYLTARHTGAKVLIVDNLTCLTAGYANLERAAAFMKTLKRIREELGLSILILAHTPKRRFSLPLTENELHGSKIIANFADNIFAIGHSRKDDTLRYVKHIKARNTRMEHGAQNVVLYRIEKMRMPSSGGPRPSKLGDTPGNFLGMRYVGLGSENDHLFLPRTDLYQDRESLARRIVDLARRGKSQRRIAAALDISAATVNRYLAEDRAKRTHAATHIS